MAKSQVPVSGIRSPARFVLPCISFGSAVRHPWKWVVFLTALALMVTAASVWIIRRNQISKRDSARAILAAELENWRRASSAEWMRRARLRPPDGDGPPTTHPGERLRAAILAAGPFCTQADQPVLAYAEAAAALTNRRFDEVLRWTDEAIDSGSHADPQLRALLMQLRGDALFGAGKWQQAFEVYRRIPPSRDDHELSLDLIKISVCLSNMMQLDGQQEDADVLAECLEQLGVQLDVAGRADEAWLQYERSIAVQAESPRPGDDCTSRFKLAATHFSYALSLHRGGRHDLALQKFDQAGEMLRTLREQGHSGASIRLADTLMNRGVALLAAQQPQAALKDLDESTELLLQIVSSDDRPAVAQMLVSSLNNRAHALGELDRDAEAIGDYDQAIQILDRLKDEPRSASSAKLALCLANRGGVQIKLGRLSEASEDYRRSAELLAAQWQFADSPQLETELATSLKEHGLVQLQLGRRREGAAALERACAIFQKHVQRGAPPEVALHLADSNNALALFYADPDAADGQGAVKAVSLAARACELTLWSDPQYLETLSVASAAAGDAEGAALWRRRAAALDATAR